MLEDIYLCDLDWRYGHVDMEMGMDVNRYFDVSVCIYEGMGGWMDGYICLYTQFSKTLSFIWHEFPTTVS